MEIATNNQSILGSVHMQPLGPQPLGMLYPGTCSVWQPVPGNAGGPLPVPVPVSLPVPVPSAAAMTEVPKESIIANTDFNMTSVIAKRRLSSKKRRMQRLSGSTGSDVWTPEGSSQSPGSSANGSPAITSAVSTPMVTERSDEDPFGHHREVSKASTATTATVSSSRTATAPTHSETSHSPTAATTSSSYSAVQLGPTAGPGGGQFMPMASSAHPVAVNPVLSQLQQGLNYRFLQEQSLLHHQQQQQQQQQQAAMGRVPATSSAHVVLPQPVVGHSQRVSGSVRQGTRPDVTGTRFKWCTAHVTIAKQIQHHMQQQQQQQQDGTMSFQVHQELVNPAPSSITSSSSSSSSQSPPRQQPVPPSRGPTHSHTPPSFNSTSISQKQQQQQQTTLAPPTLDSNTVPHLALMQYGLPNNSTATALPPSYLALPYSLQDMQQLRMHQQPHQSMVPMPTHVQLAQGGIQPMMTVADSVLGLNPAPLQVVGGVPLQQAHLAQLPAVAAAAAAGTGGNPTAIIQAPSAVCSWVAPVPVMNSCIVNNPFQPGVMAAPWVK